MANNTLTLSSSTLFHLTRKPISFTSTLTLRIKARASTAITMASTTKTKVVPAVIVGGGRVGRALEDMGNGDDLLVKRGDPVPLDFKGPILVCTRNDDLEAVLEAIPRPRWNGIAT
ncbi:uncharacterized protein Pyn_12438 [Prunus yedoensis var. nudiflora]|uniref:Uncharacterized protein n=1 Tax=Prunus yedoensis var. nudiflora TaxID=2094558 RepID=A0A314ZFU5_PRUYE|nr:uncharacterized protein Pyn_12438 [Prunus yedoensis var. nudiflora]